MDKVEFKEELIFNQYKDQIIYNTDWFRSRVKDKDINVEKVYRRIVNYQIDKYGESLYKNNIKPGRDFIDTKQQIVDEGKRMKGRKKKWNSKKEF